MKEDNNYAIIVAAGRGQRMNSDMPKQFLILDGKPVLSYTLAAFDRVPSISEIVLVISKEYIDYVKNEILAKCNIKKPVLLAEGGIERQQSVYNGLKVLPKDADIVVIHDGARPLITPTVIEKSIEAAQDFGSAVVGVPAKDTIKQVNEGGSIAKTLNRGLLWYAQTPQTFRCDIITKAHEKAKNANFTGTDDASLVERLNIPVKLVMGEYRNIKITTPEDLIIAQNLMNFTEN